MQSSQTVAVNGMECELDLVDVKILESLGKYSPRNLSLVAKKTGLKRGTVWKRVKRLSSLFSLKCHANVYHTYLGLKKAVVLAWAAPGLEDLLFGCMSAHDFRNYISRCYGTSEGCYGVFTIPSNHADEFLLFLEEIKKLGIARKIEVQWSTCFQSVNITSDWFDPKSETWIFSWDDWISNLPVEGTKLPLTLTDPKGFPIKADETDLLILEELEVDATRSFRDIAGKLNLPRQTVEYHYESHIVKRNLIEDIQITVSPFDRKGMAEALFFNFRFKDTERMAKFANSLLDKPFVHTLGKVLGQPALVAYLHFLSRKNFREFTNALSKVIELGFLEDYNYAFLDLEKTARETVRHELFKDGAWTYNQDELLNRLQKLFDRGKSNR